MEYTLRFSAITMKLSAQVGIKNAFLGEMFHRLGPDLAIPDGFAITAEAYRAFLEHRGLGSKLAKILNSLDSETLSNVEGVGAKAQKLILNAPWPDSVWHDVLGAYADLRGNPPRIEVAVRASAAAEGLPAASFVGQLDSSANVPDEKGLFKAIQQSFASLFSARVLSYRLENGFDRLPVAVSVGIQRMVATGGPSGRALSRDPLTGKSDALYIQGPLDGEENAGDISASFRVSKESVRSGRPGFWERGPGPVLSILSGEEIFRLAAACLRLEDHYGQPMEMEWMKDGISGKLLMIQARPVPRTAGLSRPLLAADALHFPVQVA